MCETRSPKPLYPHPKSVDVDPQLHQDLGPYCTWTSTLPEGLDVQDLGSAGSAGFGTRYSTISPLRIRRELLATFHAFTVCLEHLDPGP